MKSFVIPINPYDDVRLYMHRQATFESGKMTVLVGCNGSGKSTLMMLMKDQMKRNPDILIMDYDDRRNGGYNMMDWFGVCGNTNGLVEMAFESEGERIMTGVGYFVSSIRRKIAQRQPKELWIFLDAVGSGLSIDGIREIKALPDIIVEDNPNVDVYFIVSTNEFEFADGEDCIDVTTFRHRRFKGYAAFRNYILTTRKRKERRYEKIRARQKKEMDSKHA